jgi:hypothetical protein
MLVPIFDDYLTFKNFGKAIGRCERTVERWAEKPDGLPYLKVGRFKLVHVPTAKDWLLSHVKQRNPRRGSKTAKHNPHRINKKAELEESPA